MSDKTDQTSHAATWVTSVIVFVVLYILSPGPVVWFMMKLNVPPSSGIQDFIGIMYKPLELVYENVPMVKNCYDAYFRLLGIQ